MASKSTTSPSASQTSGGQQQQQQQAKSGKKSGGGKNMAEATESIPHLEPQNPNELPHMSDNERDRITEVFKMYETDVRSAAMHPEVSSFSFWSFYLLLDLLR